MDETQHRRGRALFRRCALIGLALTLTGMAAADDLARELPRIKPLDPAQALASFRVPAGFQLEAVAVEPLVTNPVSVCFDADGRLYVVEMRGYPFPEQVPSGGVALLEDRDGDGRFETRSRFLAGLSWPTSIVPYKGGVFIAAAPHILYAKDTSGDGVADIKEVMFTGFGTENVQGLVNGLLWGPDNWIYGVTSSNGGTIRNLARPDQRRVELRGRDFRFKADGSAFEPTSGGGQFGHSFDDWGHRFTCNNSNHIRQIVLPAHYLKRNPLLIPPAVILDIAAEGAAAPVFRISPPEPWRVVRTRERAADAVMARSLPPTELFATGFFTSATGITIYRGTAYPPEYRGNAFVGDVGGNLVHRKTVTVAGATFLATRADANREFLASSDNWFRPVNFANTPYGTLLVLDMYRETIEHPLSIPEHIKQHLDLTSGKDRGRLYNLVYTGAAQRAKPKLDHASSRELVQHLADPDAWWRETAQRLLLERRDRSVVPLLVRMVRERPSALGRLHALYVLDALDALDDEAMMLGLADPEPGVREQAIRLSEHRLARAPAVRSKLLAVSDDPDPMVRFQLALSLGEVKRDPRVLVALARLAVRDRGSAWVRAAVLSSIGGWPLEFVEALAQQPGFFAGPDAGAWLDEVAFLVGSERKPEQAERLLARLADAGLASDALMRAVLGLARGQGRSGGSFQALAEGSARSRIAPLLADAARLMSADVSVERRVLAIRLLAVADPKGARESFCELLDARQAVAVQMAALQALGAHSDRAVARQIIQRFRAMSPSVRREAIEVLFARREGIEELLDALQSRHLTVSEIDPVRWTQMQNHADRAVRSRAQSILTTATPAARDRTGVLASYRPALRLAGNARLGEEVFVKICATCHQAEGRGFEVGPNLATVANRAPEELLLHILDPNREVAPNYVNYNVATASGRVFSGIIAEESESAVVLKRAEGASDVIPRDQIESIRSTAASLMPEGLEQGLSSQDVANLIAFVRSIKPAAPAPAPTTARH
jgi:putative membrane-bound dehydrogenase-like protein